MSRNEHEILATNFIVVVSVQYILCSYMICYILSSQACAMINGHGAEYSIYDS